MSHNHLLSQAIPAIYFQMSAALKELAPICAQRGLSVRPAERMARLLVPSSSLHSTYTHLHC